MDSDQNNLAELKPDEVEDSPAWMRTVFAIMEKRGYLVRRDKSIKYADGVLAPTYYSLLNNPQDFDREYARAEWHHCYVIAERKGVIRKTGKYERTEDGLEPCWEAVHPRVH